MSARLARWRRPLATHDPGKIVGDLAIAVALGGDAAADVAVLRAQPAVLGPVASYRRVSGLIAAGAMYAEDALAAISGARATARERVWSWAGAPTQDALVVIDLDATLVIAHSDKEDASRTWKHVWVPSAARLCRPRPGRLRHRRSWEACRGVATTGPGGLEHRRRPCHGARHRAVAQIPAALRTLGRPAAGLAALRDGDAPIEPRRVADLPVTRALS